MISKSVISKGKAGCQHPHIPLSPQPGGRAVYLVLGWEIILETDMALDYGFLTSMRV